MSLLRKWCQYKIIETHQKYLSKNMTNLKPEGKFTSKNAQSLAKSVSKFWHCIILKAHRKYQILKTILSVCSSSVWVAESFCVHKYPWEPAVNSKNIQKICLYKWKLFSFIIFTLGKWVVLHMVFSSSL